MHYEPLFWTVMLECSFAHPLVTFWWAGFVEVYVTTQLNVVPVAPYDVRVVAQHGLREPRCHCPPLIGMDADVYAAVPAQVASFT